MLCSRPYMLGAMPCPCGKCPCCRINRRRVWAHRILLESFKHGDSCFVTLTYNDAHVPDALDKSHYQKWLKRLRASIVPRQIRYFLAGEYGSNTGRPHFHAALFGLDVYTAGGLDGSSGLVNSSWIVGRKPDGSIDRSSLGFTNVGTLTWESAQYIAGYLTKKIYDEYTVNGVPEFSRMSLRPGIGAGAMCDVAISISTDAGLDEIVRNHDVSHVLKHGKRLLPLGRYLRRRLRAELGFVSQDTPSEAVKLQGLRSAAEVAAARSQLKSQGFQSWEADKLVLDTYRQKIHNMESRFKIRDSERTLR